MYPKILLYELNEISKKKGETINCAIKMYEKSF